MIAVNYKVMEIMGTRSGAEKFGVTNTIMITKGFDGFSEIYLG
jgi:hypothetical protein